MTVKMIRLESGLLLEKLTIYVKISSNDTYQEKAPVTTIRRKIKVYSYFRGNGPSADRKKYTLISAYRNEYLSLDRIAILEQARNSPESFISHRKSPFAIDECQLAPELFSELKEYANLREQFHYRPELHGSFFQYRKNSGAYLPLAFHSNIRTVGILPILELKVNRSAYLCAESFLKTYKNAKVTIAHQGEEFERLSTQLISVPWESI